MPNWCDNTVMIKGTKEEIVELKEKLYDYSNKNVFNFEAIKKCPQELRSESAPQRNQQRAAILNKKYGASDWYQWQVNNWGTKWDTSDSYLDYADEESASWYFSTAWSPPEGIYNELSRRFPDLSISWFFDEPGMQIAGYLNNPINGG